MKLETERLIIREYTLEDFDAIHQYGQDPDVLKYMLWGPNTKEETRAFLENAIQERQVEPRKSYSLALVKKDTQTLIGGISLTIDHDRAEIGWILKKGAWEKGYATEAARTLIRISFEVLEVDAIYATCDAENEASYHVMMKCGMRQIRFEKEARLSPHLKPMLRDQRRCEITRNEFMKSSTIYGEKESYGRTV